MSTPKLTKLFEFKRRLAEARGYTPPKWPENPSYALSSELYDKFPRTEQEFSSMIDQGAKRLLGPDWKQVIDRANGGTGLVDQLIKQLWDGHWSASEAAAEIEIMYDLIQANGGIPEGYQHLSIKQGVPQKFGKKFQYNPKTRSVEPRTFRAMSPEDFEYDLGYTGEEGDGRFDDETPEDVASYFDKNLKRR